MASPRPAAPVKFFLGLIYSPVVSLWDFERKLQSAFGIIDRKSPVLEFEAFTDYYAPEMGLRLFRTWWSLYLLEAPGRLPELKLLANKLEDEYRDPEGARGRYVNIDPGYLNESRLVLASCKDFSHRIHLRDGVYGEVTLICRGNGFKPLEWTYPDYRSDEALRFFETLKQDYRNQMKGAK